MYSVRCLFFVLPWVLFISIQCQKMCTLNDYVCMTKGAQKLLESVPDKDIEPMHVDEVTGTTDNVKYKLTNVTLSGLTNCKVTFASANKVESAYEHHLTCPKLIINYNYEVKGKINALEIEGKSDGQLTATDYVIITYGKYGINVSETDNIPHFYTKSFYIDTHPGSVTLESGKLLNTKGEDIAPQVTMLVNNNWRAYERHMRDPLMTRFMALLLSAFDKKLSTLTLSDSFPDES